MRHRRLADGGRAQPAPRGHAGPGRRIAAAALRRLRRAVRCRPPPPRPAPPLPMPPRCRWIENLGREYRTCGLDTLVDMETVAQHNAAHRGASRCIAVQRGLSGGARPRAVGSAGRGHVLAGGHRPVPPPQPILVSGPCARAPGRCASLTGAARQSRVLQAALHAGARDAVRQVPGVHCALLRRGDAGPRKGHPRGARLSTRRRRPVLPAARLSGSQELDAGKDIFWGFRVADAAAVRLADAPAQAALS